MTWPIVALGDAAQIARDSVAASGIQSGTAYVGLENIDGTGGFVGVKEIEAGELASSKFRFTQHHVLFGKLRPYLRKISRPSFGGICSTDILPLLPSDQTDRNYLFHVLRRQSFVDEVTSLSSGANLPRISPKVLAEMLIPLPPLAEQRRIAAILDKADALRTQRRAAIAKLDELQQSVFLDMLGDPVTNPRGWPSRTLETVSEFHAGNSLPEAVKYTGQVGGFLALKVSDMNLPGNEEIIRTSVSWIDGERRGAIKCPAGAVLFPKRGGAIGTNKKRILSRPAYLDPNLMGVSVSPEHMTPIFLLHWFKQFDLSDIASGSSVPQLNKRDLAPLVVHLPPLREQEKFTVVAKQIGHQKRALQRHASHLNTLFASLQHRAFAGEL